MTSPDNKIGYIPELDGIRGAAILAVMFFHAGEPFFKGGFIGVDVFFVLSGFLITSLIINEYDDLSSLSLKNFYMRRLLRLGPALFLLLSVFTLLSFFFLSKEEAQSNFTESIIALFYMSNWVRAFAIHPSDYLGHTWSLSIEEQFYILWPLTLLALLRRFNNRWHVAFAAFIIAILAWVLRVYLLENGSSFERLYNGLDTRADALMTGCTLGIIVSSGLLKNKMLPVLSIMLSVLSPFAIFFLAFICTTMSWKNPQLYYWIFFAVEMSTAIIILHILVNKNTLVHKLFSMKWIVWTGSISYGLYLWHYLVYEAMDALSLHLSKIIVYGTFVSYIIAALSFYLLEKPVLKLKKKFYSHPEKLCPLNR